MTEFISKDKIFINKSKLGNILLESENYLDFHKKLEENNIKYEVNKTYEVVQSGFIDFNNHLYEDINHMNSISVGLFMEMSFITFNIYIWTSLGEGFAIFKHILLGSEINKLKNEDDIKDYIFKYLNQLQEGIVKTYNKDLKESLEAFGEGIERKKLPLANILSCIDIENNINDLK